MKELSTQDLQQALQELQRLYTAVDLARLPAVMLEVLQRLIPADSYAYDEVNPARQRALGIVSPRDAQPDARRLAAFTAFLQTHPIFQHWQDRKNRPEAFDAVTTSDLVSVSELDRLAIYREFYREEGVKDQLAMLLAFPEPMMVAVACNRGNRSFTARDREFLNLLRPHLAQAYRNAERLSELHAAAGTTSAMRRGILAVQDHRTTLWHEGSACALLHEYFPRKGKPTEIPRAVSDWLRTQHRGGGGAHWSVAGEEGILTLRLLNDPHEASPRKKLLLIEEHPRRQLRHQTDIRGASLSPRLQQTLRELLQGSSAKQIARSLRISAHTVNEYIERLYRHFGVSSRGELLSLFVTPTPVTPR